MAEELAPEICVIGGGPGGIALSVAAANQGLPVVLVERDRIGGANLREGGVPVAALVAAANLHEALRRAPAFGVTGAPLQVNMAKVNEHMRSVSEATAANMSRERLEAFGVTVIAGTARFTDTRTVMVGDTVIRARNFVIATGSAPVVPRHEGLEEIETIDLAGILESPRKPAHLIVLGASPRGLEIAQALTRLGIDSSIIDATPALDGEDPELVSPLLDRLRAEGIRIRERAGIVGIARRKGGIRITVNEDGEEMAVDGSHLMLVAARSPNVEGLGLENAGVAHGPSGIAVDRRLRTANRRVYAIGDAVAGDASASRAEHHAARVLAAIIGGAKLAESDVGVPFVLNMDPEFARVGLREAEARSRHKHTRVLRVPFAENDRAQAERTTAGLVKVIATDRGRLLGAGAVGRGAGELIAFFSLALSSGLGIEALRSFPAPYPSRAEIVHRIATAFDGPGRAPIRRSGAFSFLRRSG